ncbi:nucleotide sugar dehydrogenase [Akkermansiaceae bacterium]|nr:nucleotide sugar dehydrogenase [Akkermansiaceae bacterium]
MKIIEKFNQKQATIGVVGLGYVGLPLAIGFAQNGHRVLGIDVDQFKADEINAGRSYIEHIDGAGIAKYSKSGLLRATVDFSLASECDALIICVPTPLSGHHEPDLSYVIQTLEALLPHLRAEQVISLESTTYPGTTEEELRPRIESQGFTIGENFYLAYSPEREDPGNPEFSSTNIPKVMGGSTENCSKVAQALYECVVEKVIPVKSTKVAEFSKLLENIYRSVNIGLVNELKIAADRMGIDIWDVIDAASTKPFGFKAFYPGPGLGGHCIPIDPFYLTWKAKEFGVHTRFIELAGEINESMPAYVVRNATKALNTRKKSINGSAVLLMGLAYKENVDDMRESPTFQIMDELKQLGADVSYFDPHIPVITPTREHADWTGLEGIQWNEETLNAFDCVIIATDHKRFDYKELVEWADLIIDTRNAVAKSGVTADANQLFLS